jgi:hypothetical protein
MNHLTGKRQDSSEGYWLPDWPHNTGFTGPKIEWHQLWGPFTHWEGIVSLFEQLQSLDMLSLFPTATAARCSLRFWAQYKQLSCQIDYMSVIWGTWEAEMRRICSRSENVQKKKIREQSNLISKIATEILLGGGTQVVQHVPSKYKTLRPIILHN